MTIVPVLWYRQNKNKEYFVKIRITEGKKVSYINLNISIPKRLWSKSKVSNQHPDSLRINNLINQTIQEIKSRSEVTTLIVQSPSKTNKSTQPKGSPAFTFPESSIGGALQRLIEDLQSNGKIGTAKKHKVILNHLIKSKLDALGLNEFDSSHINKFRKYLIDTGVQPQGRHSYEKVIKKIFTRSIESGLRTKLHPYTGIRTKVPTPKPPRHLGKKEIHMLEEMLIYGFGRDNLHYTSIAMFLFSTFSFGMRFGDVVTLKWSIIKDLHIGYNMRKTQHALVVKLTSKHANLIKSFLPESLYPKLIVDGKDQFEKLKNAGVTNENPILELEHKYLFWKVEFARRLKELPEDLKTWQHIKKNPLLNGEETLTFKKIIQERDKELFRLITIHSNTSSDYIFPLLSNERKTLTKEYNEVSSKNASINLELKVVAKRLGIAPFSFHAARHSFANNIRDVEPDILKISRMLGHHSLSQTQDYLKRFERTEGYKSNDLFIGMHDDFFLM
jgi:integrase